MDTLFFTGNVQRDALQICEYIDAYYDRFGVSSASIQIFPLMGVVQTMYTNMPDPYTPDNASPFKKAAAFTVNFVASGPLLTPITHFGRLATHQNAIIAYCLCVDALEGATIQMNDDSECALTNRISVSQHFFQDLILAFTRMLPHEHFSLCALIYESLAYQSNPDASYDRVI